MLIIAVSGPGRMLVSVGAITIAELTNGTLISRGMALFEAAPLVADLTHVDGAVVMTTGLDLLRFDPWAAPIALACDAQYEI